MFILALRSIQARNEATDISYYQVAGKRYSKPIFQPPQQLKPNLGIHGYPYVPWQYKPDKTVNPGLGYCTHSSAIFTTWHRPYLLLIEVRLLKSIFPLLSGALQSYICSLKATSSYRGCCYCQEIHGLGCPEVSSCCGAGQNAVSRAPRFVTFVPSSRSCN